MTVTDVDKNTETRTLTITSRLEASIERVWKITAVDEPRSLEFEDAFADKHGNPNPDMPGDGMTIRVTLSEKSGATSMEIRTSFPNDETMEQMITMGMAEGMTEALGQVDALLAG